MPDWRNLVEQHLAKMRLPSHVCEEVWTELADHLDDFFGRLLASGIGEEEAVRKTMESVSQWKALECGIVREKEGSMSRFGKQFMLPSGIAFAIATLALAIEIRLGPRPAVWNYDAGALVIYRMWPIALLITGAISAYLSMRAGAGRFRRVLVAVTPALYMLGVMLFVLAAIASTHVIQWVPPQPVHWMALLVALTNWVALPAIALLLGALPFLGKSAEQTRTIAHE
jgi:hypothetical protein